MTVTSRTAGISSRKICDVVGAMSQDGACWLNSKIRKTSGYKWNTTNPSPINKFDVMCVRVVLGVFNVALNLFMQIMQTWNNENNNVAVDRLVNIAHTYSFVFRSNCINLCKIIPWSSASSPIIVSLMLSNINKRENVFFFNILVLNRITNEQALRIIQHIVNKGNIISVQSTAIFSLLYPIIIAKTYILANITKACVDTFWFRSNIDFVMYLLSSNLLSLRIGLVHNYQNKFCLISIYLNSNFSVHNYIILSKNYVFIS